MARKLKKLPKWAIKQAGGINKKAWALARGKRRKRVTRRRKAPVRRRRASAKRGNPGRKPMGIVGKLNAGLRGLKLGLPALGSVMGRGLDSDSPADILARYSGFKLKEKEFDLDLAKVAAVFYAGNVVEQKAMSMLKVPQMAGKKKILSLAANFLPEISAIPHVMAGDMGAAVNEYGTNSIGYQPLTHQGLLNPAVRDQWLKALGGRIGLGLFSRFAGPMINKHLPKGVNI